MSFYTCFDWFKKLSTFLYVLNLKIDVVPKALRAVVIRRFSLNEAPLGLFKCISIKINIKEYRWDQLRIDCNFCSVHEEITSIKLYTPCNLHSRLHKGVYNLIEGYTCTTSYKIGSYINYISIKYHIHIYEADHLPALAEYEQLR
jgi:hypothetical protein